MTMKKPKKIHEKTSPASQERMADHGQFDHRIAVVGAGLTGLTAALALAQNNGHKTNQVLLIAPHQSRTDPRTTALLERSVRLIDQLGVWQSLEEHAFPLKTMRIVDHTRRLVRAPEVNFSAQEIGLAAFGYNIKNDVLIEALEKAITDQPNIVRITQAATGLTCDDKGGFGAVVLDNGKEIAADLIVAADGRNSPCRNGAAIEVSQWSYPQQAIVLDFTHTLSHDDTSTEFHTPSGPFTVVPLGRNRSSLVFVVTPKQADEISRLSPERLNLELEQRMDSFLGKVRVEGELRGFALSGMTAKRFGRDNLVLVGEAAHVFPPIGAQGFNLGIRDIAELVALTAKAETFNHIGENYHAARMADISGRTVSVDLLNRSLLTDFLPVQMARSLGLYALSSISPLRRFVMRQGVSPDFEELSPFSLIRKALNQPRQFVRDRGRASG